MGPFLVVKDKTKSAVTDCLFINWPQGNLSAITYILAESQRSWIGVYDL